MTEKNKTVLLTGTSGYIGGRLLKPLEIAGYKVRCLARNPEFLSSRTSENTELIKGDVKDLESLKEALKNVDIAYYLIHSMGSKGSFEEEDRLGAKNFALACKEANVERIIYLGGLGDNKYPLSKHLKSRHEVGKIFKEFGILTIELRASIVIGSGSLSFEMIRALEEHLPVMITPRWVSVKAQPIAISDLLNYLLQSAEIKIEKSTIFEIGGKDIVSYGEIMGEYAKQRNLYRVMIPVPFLTPWLSSLWLGLVTPLYANVGRKLVDSIKFPTVVNDRAALNTFNNISQKSISEAISEALKNEDKEFSETKWSDALSSGNIKRDYGGVHFRNRIVDSRTIEIKAKKEDAFKPIEQIGGQTGWYFWDWIWQIRGLIDLLFGGVGMRRGRRNFEKLNIGDVVDCWRVENIEPNKKLILFAEMKLPGRAWLEFEVEEKNENCIIRQTAIFDPIGLSGIAYWYSLYFIHEIIFKNMLRNIGKAAIKNV
jgi:uncharacterized protein YbjT (DUF2867 family)